MSCPRRRPSFPPNHKVCGSLWRHCRTSCESSKPSCRPGVGRRGGWRPPPRRRSGDLARRSGDCAWRAGEAERRYTAARESEIEETDDVFLASQRISACADISVALVWFAVERWSLMDAGNLRRNKARKRESGAVVSYLRDNISAIIAEGRRSPRSG